MAAFSTFFALVKQFEDEYKVGGCSNKYAEDSY